MGTFLTSLEMLFLASKLSNANNSFEHLTLLVQNMRRSKQGSLKCKPYTEMST